MIDKLTVLSWVHVTAAIVWLGGGVLIDVLVTRARRSGDPGKTAYITGEAEVVGQRIFVPSSLLVAAVGVWLTASYYSFSDLWVSLGLAGWGFSFVVGLFYLGPQSGKIKALLAEKGPGDPAVQARIARVVSVSRVETVILFAVVADMIFKPG